MSTRLALGVTAALAGLAVASRRTAGSRAVLGPRRFVRGRGWVEPQTPTTVEEVISAVESAEGDPDQVVLYHSGDASIARQIHDGLSPVLGQWVTEILYGATDDPHLLAKLQAEAQDGGGAALSYLSDTPEWVLIKAARHMDKSQDEMTVADIERHGHLSIFLFDRDDSSVLHAVEPSDDHFETLDGRRLRFYETELYEEPDLYTGGGGRTEVPWGVEPGDYITADSPMPAYTLTGEALVAFLRWWHRRQRARAGSGNRPQTRRLVVGHRMTLPDARKLKRWWSGRGWSAEISRSGRFYKVTASGPRGALVPSEGMRR